MQKFISLFVLSFVVFTSNLLNANENSESEIWSCDIREKHGEAEENFEPCFYAGAGLSFSRFDPSRNNSSWSLYSRGGEGWHIYGGYHFKPDWFAEIDYFDLGTVRVRDNNPNLNRNGTIRYKAPVAMIGYYFDLPEKVDSYIPEMPFDLYLKLGISALDTKPRPSNLPVEELSNIQLAGALGLEYRLHQNWKLRTEYKTFDIDAYAFNFSAAYIFGKKKTAPVKKEPEPELKQEPIISAAVCNMFEGSLDGINFKSGSDVLTEDSKLNLQTTLDALIEYDTLQLEIHAYTDNVGREAPNLELSKKRAASVKRFLVEKGINESRLISEGHGEESPIADNETAEGKALNRRVEIKPIDKNSCGKKEPVVVQGACEIFEGSLSGVVFKSGSDELTEGSKLNLQKTLDALLSVETLTLEIHAHTDSQGNELSNLTLSQKRAASVKQYFVEKGVEEKRLSSKGYGEQSPIADNANAEGRALNRRVELRPLDNNTCDVSEPSAINVEEAPIL